MSAKFQKSSKSQIPNNSCEHMLFIAQYWHKRNISYFVVSLIYLLFKLTIGSIKFIHGFYKFND
jgi:hypothetical protein